MIMITTLMMTGHGIQTENQVWGYFILSLKQGSVLSVVLFSFTEECKQISDVTNLKNLSAMGLNFNLITEPPQVSVLFSQ